MKPVHTPCIGLDYMSKKSFSKPNEELSDCNLLYCPGPSGTLHLRWNTLIYMAKLHEIWQWEVSTEKTVALD